ncbi:TonB-dependent vitamin B12 receptor [Oleiagrimonas sp. MCCC 1A03011]|uniref:TonB-dependent vitamin B12 receptor n=1 Tax=Oleiagrimonas sp. MCCC 1A03011 TaxID=1926883 RepID=UPI000DC398FF|nr:TonB-dependent vitamin B12 receptor [Oleiagrimonas sp. MCCC 1A03011]RAP58119.1 TonB-dependent vitamin B12 receptor [Oleiagrimonas sp. MCCC 1A03011]
MYIKIPGAPFAFLTLLTASAAATAASPMPASSDLKPVVVTATRTDVSLDDTLAPVTVLTRDDIARLQPTSLVGLLEGLPGVSLANSGGIGQQTSLFLRGTSSTHTLVLIDGVRVGSVSAGLAAFEQIPVDQIERIEVVRGPRSSLYGADAIGGVIQIFTRHGQAGEGITPSFRLTGGGHGYRDGQVGLSGGTRHAWYNLSVGGTYTRGINSCKQGAGTVFAGCFTNEPDADGYRSWNGLFNVGYRWDNGTELAGNFLRNKSYVEYDGSYQNQSRHVQQVAGARLRLQPTAAWTVTLTAGQSLDKASNYKNGTFVGYGDSRRNQFGWQNDIALGDGQLLTVGLDDQHEHIDSDTAYLRTAREDVGAYAQYQASFGANEVQISGRRDHNQQFGNHNTGALAWGYHFDGGLLLTASYGTAFHAPTFNDLYYPSYPGFPPSADPNLKPEKSRNLELGLGAVHTHWHWRVDTYRNTIRDLIALDSHFTPGNISRARIRGAEAQVGGDVGAWRVAGYATWLQPENRDGGPNDGNWLPRRAGRSARIDLDRTFGAFSVGTTVSAYGHRYDDAANLHRLGGYTTVDLRASWQFRPRWQLQARLANALDRDYETVYYFNQPGRTAYLTLRYTPSR